MDFPFDSRSRNKIFLRIFPDPLFLVPSKTSSVSKWILCTFCNDADGRGKRGGGDVKSLHVLVPSRLSAVRQECTRVRYGPDRSIDRRIIEPTVPCNIVSGGSEGETKEEKAEGERGAFRFQAYFITKPQFLPGFAVVSPRRERKREREREREGGGKKRNRERGKAVVVRSVGTRLPARSPRDLAPLAEFSTLAIDVT